MQDNSDIRFYTIHDEKHLNSFTNHKMRVEFPNIPEPYSCVVFRELFEKYRIDLEDGNEELWKDFISFSNLFDTYASFEILRVLNLLGFKRNIKRERDYITLLYGIQS